MALELGRSPSTAKGSKDEHPSVLYGPNHTAWRKAQCVQFAYLSSADTTPSPSDIAGAGCPAAEQAAPLDGLPVFSAFSADASSRINNTVSKSSLDNCRAFVFSRFLRRWAFFNSLAKRFRSSRTRCWFARKVAMSAFKLARFPGPAAPEEHAMASACTAEWLAAWTTGAPRLPAALEAAAPSMTRSARKTRRRMRILVLVHPSRQLRRMQHV